MLKNHMSTCKKTHVNMQHLFLMFRAPPAHPSAASDARPSTASTASCRWRTPCATIAAPLGNIKSTLSGVSTYYVCLVLSAAFLRGNGVIHRTQKVIQGDDNCHVGRPCEVSLAPPYPELFASYGTSTVTRTSGRGHVAEA